MSIIWNTGSAAARFRARAQRDAAKFNLKLKEKNKKAAMNKIYYVSTPIFSNKYNVVEFTLDNFCNSFNDESITEFESYIYTNEKKAIEKQKELNTE